MSKIHLHDGFHKENDVMLAAHAAHFKPFFFGSFRDTALSDIFSNSTLSAQNMIFYRKLLTLLVHIVKICVRNLKLWMSLGSFVYTGPEL